MIFSCFSDLELKPVGSLDVKLIEAKGLTNKDLIGKSDPYAVLFVRPLRDRMKTSKTIVRQLILSMIMSIIFFFNFCARVNISSALFL